SWKIKRRRTTRIFINRRRRRRRRRYEDTLPFYFRGNHYHTDWIGKKQKEMGSICFLAGTVFITS
ncbi:hypothetical protein, partial [Streptomyces fildesensis]|uniref:hypothetical protein n=1 Tax=Streptomyces fildesensis TaxID=375757 RepID=UPI001E541545